MNEQQRQTLELIEQLKAIRKTLGNLINAQISQLTAQNLAVPRSLRPVEIPDKVVEFAQTYKACQYNQTEMARQLGVTKQAIGDKLKRYSSKYPSLFTRDSTLDLDS